MAQAQDCLGAIAANSLPAGLCHFGGSDPQIIILPVARRLGGPMGCKVTGTAAVTVGQCCRPGPAVEVTVDSGSESLCPAGRQPTAQLAGTGQIKLLNALPVAEIMKENRDTRRIHCAAVQS